MKVYGYGDFLIMGIIIGIGIGGFLVILENLVGDFMDLIYNGGSIDVFVVCFDMQGLLKWSILFGGDGMDVFFMIFLLLEGDVVIGGKMNSLGFSFLFQMIDNGYIGMIQLIGVMDVFLIVFRNIENGYQMYYFIFWGVEGVDVIIKVVYFNMGDLFFIGYFGSVGLNFIMENMFGCYCQDYLGGDMNYIGYSNVFLFGLKFDYSFCWGMYFGGIVNSLYLDFFIDMGLLIVVCNNCFYLVGIMNSQINFLLQVGLIGVYFQNINGCGSLL